jgi:hypothetical protein
VGEPLCPDCYDYPAHVLFTWHAPALWHRFVIALRRLISRQLRRLGEEPGAVRVSYVKIVELQHRGVPHFHAVIRLDAAVPDESPLPAAPDTALTTANLAVLVRRAAATAHLDTPGAGGELVTLRFGEQIDIQPLHRTGDQGAGTTDRRVASYLAKYVTKSVDEFGLTARRLSPEAIDRLDLRPHVRMILHTIIALADNPGPAEMTRWLHTLGYRGHITTKTRRYSTTMGALRAQRATWRGHPEPATADAEEWAFADSGHANDGERLLAASAAQRAIEQRHAAREALRDQANDQP